MRTVYINGEYVAENEAKVSVFDRGFMFADSIYEVTAVHRGSLIGISQHISRLRRSLSEIGICLKLTDSDLQTIHHQLIERNQLNEGLIYLQVSRGVQDRNFLYSDAPLEASVVAFTQVKQLVGTKAATSGISVVGLPDLRWHRSDIKSTQLLYACMAKDEAKRQGADDAWLIRDGYVTEGASNNVFIVLDGVVVTRELSSLLLPGITRDSILKCLDEADINFVERPFTLEEAYSASEAFITSSTSFVYPVVQIDGQSVGSGYPGPVTKTLQHLYMLQVSENV
ncbi:D-amino-acid transaminase [Pseudomonas parafulva]|uniref:D-amino-acid transaminase n=1 Tax=Pseudomonas parafulva TaxID=157782 RepID=UPI000734DFA7|nr:D-amino-acid transaminase [Pseudomonas parafulva]KTT01912.1 D-amino acid aminotransferase [Pseudomonas parafulva]